MENIFTSTSLSLKGRKEATIYYVLSFLWRMKVNSDYVYKRSWVAILVDLAWKQRYAFSCLYYYFVQRIKIKILTWPQRYCLTKVNPDLQPLIWPLLKASTLKPHLFAFILDATRLLPNLETLDLFAWNVHHSQICLPCSVYVSDLKWKKIFLGKVFQFTKD